MALLARFGQSGARVVGVRYADPSGFAGTRNARNVLKATHRRPAASKILDPTAIQKLVGLCSEIA